MKIFIWTYEDSSWECTTAVTFIITAEDEDKARKMLQDFFKNKINEQKEGVATGTDWGYENIYEQYSKFLRKNIPLIEISLEKEGVYVGE